ncbi:MAG: saccharopine dehydrogenase C-terminal domain-containing protein [Candidatus Thermoplasmatota archaeon]|nr:saccharopine dehydrogenase C-terminal domain-containing protein [Candidatus Thermoplasmatota archaeon]
MARICVLGGGLVGRFVACTLHERDHQVMVIDAEPLDGLPAEINCIQSFVNPETISENVSGFDVVVNCLPGRIGHAVRGPLLSIEGMSVADLAFTAEDPRMYNEMANETGSRLIYDVGIAPGLSNALLMSAQSESGPLESAKIWVGGNPQKPDEEWSYIAPFSPSDVIEEYTRPARIRRGGKIITEPALSERHPVKVPGYGQMEAFLTDGARSLLDTIDSEELVEYTVRWPGHIQRYLDGNESEKELIDAWMFDAQRPEFTWLAVEATGADGTLRWDVIDEGKDGWSSMARTTGLVTVEVAEMLAEDLISKYGVMAPECLGENRELLDRLVNAMRHAGVRIHSSSE